jgi:glutamate/tyrosine decarboxylase-like PLP-dependent enzyme
MLQLDEPQRRAVWERVAAAIEGHVDGVRALPVSPRLDLVALRALVAGVDFARPLPAAEVLDLVIEGLRRHQVHTTHPGYYGLFNPCPGTMSVAGDALVAAFNPQIAAWSHSPFAAEVESHLLRAFALRFGFAADASDGNFCSGGAEANHSALLCALGAAFPAALEDGLRGIDRRPLVYVSAEAHHSFLKAARLSGLGMGAVRTVPVDARLRMDVAALTRLIDQDRRNGHAPFLLVATAGTTSAGAIDPVDALAAVAAREKLWLHVDAAWGGALGAAPELLPLLGDVSRADSITVDAHKWLSVPMGAGMFLTRHPQVLERTFRVAAGYMPRDAEGLPIVDPYAHSMQWSRRAIGMKLFVSLAAAGWDGYAEVVRGMTAKGHTLRARLAEAGWRAVNDTPLPLVCFVDARDPEGERLAHLQKLAEAVLASGRAWINAVVLSTGQAALRACITNHRTTEADLDALVETLAQARARVAAG